MELQGKINFKIIIVDNKNYHLIECSKLTVTNPHLSCNCIT